MGLKRFFVALIMTCFTPWVMADLEGQKPQQKGWFWGFGFGYSESIYEGKSNEFIPVPTIGYLGEKFEFFGPLAQYTFFEQGPFSARAKVAVRFNSYESDDSVRLRGMEERKRSIDAGFELAYQPRDVARFGVQYMHDTLSRHKGSVTRFKISRQFSRGPFFFVPEVSANYLDADFVDYYYGVQANEALPDRPAFDGRSGMSYRADLNFSTPILFGGFTRIDLGYVWYPNEVSDSPIVDESEGYSIRFGYTRFFQ